MTQVHTLAPKMIFLLPFLSITSYAQGAWYIAQDSYSLMDNSPLITLALEADNQIEGWLRTSRPTLFIRCKENKTEIFIHVGMPANPEYGLYNEYTVRIRLDNEKPFQERWSESTNREALFAPKPIVLARQMVKAKKMLFEFIPFSANPQTVQFNISGLDEYLPKIANACKWKIQ